MNKAAMPPATGRLSLKEELWFRLRMVENCQMPLWLRRTFIRHVLRDTTVVDRYNNLGAREVLFVHVPKTGGTSMAKSLGLPHGHVPVSRFVAHDQIRFESSFRFAFVRNPWDRLYSAFNYLHAAFGLNRSRDVRWAEKNLSPYADFEQFVLALEDDTTWRRLRRWPHFRAQTDWLCMPGASEVSLDFVGRFETLQQDMGALAGLLGVDIALTHERKSRSYGRKTFTPNMVRIIGERYRRDVEILSYEWPG